MSKKIYLDYAATTPMDQRVFSVMKPYFGAKFGNPSSLHSFGQEAIKAVDEAREKLAGAIGADFHEIIFTGSATEANNLALRGALKSWEVVSRSETCLPAGRASSKQHSPDIFQPRVIISAIEHESVLETARDLEREGVEVIRLPVNREGLVDLKKLKESLNERTVLVSIMYANNEIGIIQPISRISEIIRDFREVVSRNRGSVFPLFHTDAVQALQFLDCNVNNLGVDLMTLSAHKIYGPKGVGVLYASQKSKVISQKSGSDYIAPIITGGGQEFEIRSGTENVAGICGFAKAVELIEKNNEKEAERIGELKGRFWRELKKIFPKAEVNGCQVSSVRYQVSGIKHDSAKSLPNILNVYLPGRDAGELLVQLDLAGVAVSYGSACASRAPGASHVILALGHKTERARQSLRFSFGRPTNWEELGLVIQRLKKISLR